MIKEGLYFAPQKPFKITKDMLIGDGYLFANKNCYAGKITKILPNNEIIYSILGSYQDKLIFNEINKKEEYIGFTKFRCNSFNIKYKLKENEVYFISKDLTYQQKWIREKFNNFICVKKLLNLVGNFIYGVVDLKNNKIIKNPNENIFYDTYQWLTPEQTLKYKCGVCWDTSHLCKIILDKLNIKSYEIYCEMNMKPDYPTHTFIILIINNKYYIFEVSWKNYVSLSKPFNSIKNCCKEMSDRMFKEYKRAKDITFFNEKNYPTYGCSCEEYMNYIKKYNDVIIKFEVKNVI